MKRYQIVKWLMTMAAVLLLPAMYLVPALAERRGAVPLDAIRTLGPGCAVPLGCHRKREPEREPRLRPGDG